MKKIVVVTSLILSLTSGHAQAQFSGIGAFEKGYQHEHLKHQCFKEHDEQACYELKKMDDDERQKRSDDERDRKIDDLRNCKLMGMC
jgi:site-specific DNA-cytosine methylase